MPDTGMPNMTEADAPAKPASSKGSAVTAVFMILGLSACLAVLVFQVWQWREEAREGLEALRATLVMDGKSAVITNNSPAGATGVHAPA